MKERCYLPYRALRETDLNFDMGLVKKKLGISGEAV